MMTTSLDYDGLTYAELYRDLKGRAAAAGLATGDYGVIRYAEGDYPLLRISSPGETLAVVSANIHGDEFAGALMFHEYLEEIFAYARSQGIGLIAYPCTNPTGFDRRIRYNIRNETGNNDFLRYILPDGTLTDDIGEGCDFLEWRWSSDSDLGISLPLETRFLHDELRRLPFDRIRGLADLHQDCFEDFCISCCPVRACRLS